MKLSCRKRLREGYRCLSAGARLIWLGLLRCIPSMVRNSLLTIMHMPSVLGYLVIYVCPQVVLTRLTSGGFGLDGPPATAGRGPQSQELPKPMLLALARPPHASRPSSNELGSALLIKRGTDVRVNEPFLTSQNQYNVLFFRLQKVAARATAHRPLFDPATRTVME